MNVKLQLFAVIAKQPAFHQLRSVEQLGYFTVLMQRYVFIPTGSHASTAYQIKCTIPNYIIYSF